MTDKDPEQRNAVLKGSSCKGHRFNHKMVITDAAAPFGYMLTKAHPLNSTSLILAYCSWRNGEPERLQCCRVVFVLLRSAA